METKANRKKKKKTSGKSVLISLLLVAAAMAAVILFLFFSQKHKEELRQSIISADTLRPGVTMNGVELGGMTKAEAQSALAAAEQSLIADVGFTLACNDQTFEAGHDCFDISFNTEALLDEALLLAREGELEALEDELADIAQNGRSYTIEYTVAPNSKLNELVASIAASVDTAPVNATFSVKPLEMNEDTKAPKALDVGRPEGDTTSDLRDLRFDFVEAVPGFGVNQEAVLNTLVQRTQSRQFGSVDVELSPIEADVTVATLKETLVLRSEAETSFGKSPYNRDSRVHNLKKATGLIYGMTLAPDEVFSANTILGDRTEKLGWQLAPAVIDGGAASEDQAGGGVCQVSTTMYNAVLKGDLEVVFRRAHSSKLSYVGAGLDATINTGTIDFKWKNTTTSPIYIFTWLDMTNEIVHCELYGEPFPDTFDRIELSSELVEKIEPTATEYQVYSSLVSPYWMHKNDAKAGYKYQSYATYYLGETEVEKKAIAETTYKMHPLRFYVWAGYAGETLMPEYQLALPEA